jgi:hypothetical protein
LCVLDDDECMKYLNNWDKKIPNLDVVDDYKSEKKEIQACQGKDFPFSFGDVSENSYLNLIMNIWFVVVYC